MDMTRRGMLAGLAALAASTALAAVPETTSETPRILWTGWLGHPDAKNIWGDGVNDDTEGLRALMRGDLYIYQGKMLRQEGDIRVLPKGDFYLKAPPNVREDETALTIPKHITRLDAEGTYLQIEGWPVGVCWDAPYINNKDIIVNTFG